MKFVYGAHALAMLTEREIDRGWVELTVISPTFVEPDLRHADRWRAYRAILERDGRVLRVVYVLGEDVRIVTFFFDRSRTKAHEKSLRQRS